MVAENGLGAELVSGRGVVSAWTEDLHPCFVWVLNMLDCIILGSMDIGQEVTKHGPGAVAQVVKSPRLARPGSHMGASSNPGSPASLPAPCLWPGKAVEDGPKLWDPAPAWETRKRLLALDWLSSSLCGRLGRNHWMEDLPLCLSSSLNI